jgi:uncharacterized membrane protein (UPF0127 family)
VKLITFVLVTVAAAAVGCGYGSGDSGARSDSTDLGRGTVILDRGKDTTLVEVEVAQTPEQRSRGLMGRRSLAQDEGMAFIFFEETRGGFWMKNTLIPLSIAFFDKDGEILRIMDMQPCRQAPCKVYDPGVAYWGALEVNQGAFDRWGVDVGDVVRLVQ